jgi:hypothetical protein
MRSLRFSFLLFFVFPYFQSWGQFQFRVPGEMLHHRIDFKTSELSKETGKGQWETIGKLSYERVHPADLPFNATIQTFNFRNELILTIPGTQQVYLLDLPHLLFRRLDNSYYRGYNFHAIQYLRNDSLFSHGGMGFWHANNVSTYFDFKAKEWEMTSTPDESGPRWMKSDFGGYDKKRSVISVIEFPSLYETKNQVKTYRYFEKDLRANQWTLFGEVQVNLIKDLGIKRLESEFLDGKYFFLDGSIPVWADPVTNHIYQLNTVIPMFNINFEYVFHDGFIYSYKRMNVLTNDQASIKIDSISIDKVKSISTYKGPFFIKPFPTGLIGYGAAALLILSAGGIYVYRKRKPQKVHESSIEALDGLPAGASAFLLACLEYPNGHTFSSQLFTEMMGYGSYSYETQRSVRAKLIKGINNYFWAHYRLDDVIIRQTANDDKRFSVYLIAESHYDTLKKLLNS